MQSRLIVKNFGPLKDIDIELKNVNVFIGPQASGKSALAKLFTIFKAPRKFLKDFDKDSTIDKSEIYNKAFRDTLEEYNIASFLREDSEIEFDSKLHRLSFKQGEIVYIPKMLNKIDELENLKEDFYSNSSEIQNHLVEFIDNFFLFTLKLTHLLKLENDNFTISLVTIKQEIRKINKVQFLQIIVLLKESEENLSTNTALYIPSERNFSNIIKKYSLNLLNNNVPIPKHIISFGAELEKVDISEIDLGFLQNELYYKNINGDDRIYSKGGSDIKLIEAASGIQSVLPILLPILNKKILSGHQSFVIEEPELNLFPLAQYELIKLLESKREDSDSNDNGTIHTYTTHSPYILSAINNLLFASKVRYQLFKSNMYNTSNLEELSLKSIKMVAKIIDAEIDPSIFTAYQILNGKAQSIFNEETGLIDENFIDEASDKIGDDFDALMELMSESKHAVK